MTYWKRSSVLSSWPSALYCLAVIPMDFANSSRFASVMTTPNFFRAVALPVKMPSRAPADCSISVLKYEPRSADNLVSSTDMLAACSSLRPMPLARAPKAAADSEASFLERPKSICALSEKSLTSSANSPKATFSLLMFSS